MFGEWVRSGSCRHVGGGLALFAAQFLVWLF